MEVWQFEMYRVTSHKYTYINMYPHQKTRTRWGWSWRQSKRATSYKVLQKTSWASHELRWHAEFVRDNSSRTLRVKLSCLDASSIWGQWMRGVLKDNHKLSLSLTHTHTHSLPHAECTRTHTVPWHSAGPWRSTSRTVTLRLASWPPSTCTCF